MIIIAASGNKFYPHLLESLQKYGTGGHEIKVVHEGSYPMGKLWVAYDRYIAEDYILLHDSMEVKSPEWIKEFDIKDNTKAWLGFKIYTGVSKAHIDYINNKYGDGEWNRIGVFGSILHITRKVLSTLPRIIIRNKFEDECMERELGIMLDIDYSEGYDYSRIVNDGYPNIKKILAGRQ